MQLRRVTLGIFYAKKACHSHMDIAYRSRDDLRVNLPYLEVSVRDLSALTQSTTFESNI